MIQDCACRIPSPSLPIRFSTGTITVQRNFTWHVAHHGRRAAHDGHAGRRGVDQEHAQAAAAPFRAVGGGDQLQKIRVLRLRDPSLVAVDDVMVALAHGRGAHGAGIGAGIGLRLRERRRLLAAQDRKQIFLLLRRIEREQHGFHVRTEHARSTRRQRDGARDLLPHHRHAEEAEPLTTIFRRHVEQPQTQVLRLALEIGTNVRTQRRTIHRMHLDRDELAVDEGPDRMLEKFEFLRKLEAHGGDPGHARIDDGPCRNGARVASQRAS